MVAFNQIPSSLRVPFVAVEFDSSQSQQGPSILAYRALLVGQKLASGTAVADTVVRCANVEQAIVLGGRGSMLHRKAIGWFASNKSTELWLGVLADNAGGAAATGTIVVAGPATAGGVIALYLGGERIAIGVNKDDAAADIAAAIAAAINANLDLPVTATVDTVTVTIAFRHKGLAGNAYDMRHSYITGEVLPAGVGLTITAMGGGTLNPVLTNLIAAMANFWFQIIAHPYTDATSLTAIEVDLASRFGPLRSTDGLAITSTVGNFAAHTTLGSGRNSPHSLIFAQPGSSALTPPMEFAAELAADIALAAAADPARPFQTLVLAHAAAPDESSLWSVEERDLFLHDGIATTTVGPGGVVQIERAITTYQTNPVGADDDAYLDATTLLTLLYLRYDFRTRFQIRYPRHKLANDGTKLGSGQKVITPKIAKGEALAWFREKEKQGLVEGFEQFKRDLVVERNEANPNELDFLLPPDLINQLINTNAQIQFRL